MAQTITKKPGEDIVIIDEVVLPPPDETPPPTGTVDVVAGITTTLAPGTPATVVKDPASTPAKAIFNFGIPQGIQGLPGAGSGGAGSISLGKGKVSVTDFGAKGDGSNDDAIAFTAAWNAVRGTGGEVDVPFPNNYYNFKSTFQALPDGSNQAWVDVRCRNMRAGKILYTGPSNAPAIKIVGLKGALWEGLHAALDNGRTNCQVIDIDTTPAAGSSSFNTFKSFYLNLGNGQDNVGIRTGVVSGGGADISNYAFESIAIYGGGGLHGASIPGQYAYLNQGHNTLSMVAKDGFIAFCDRAYSNVSRDGLKRGNGSVMFYGTGGAHNNIDFSFNWEQSYIVSGGRWENGRQFMIVKNGGYSNIVVQGLTVHDYHAPNNLFDILVGCSLSLDNVFATWTKSDAAGNPTKFYDPVINIAANDTARPRVGSLSVKAGGFSSNELYRKTGTAQFNIDVNGAAKVRIQYAEDFFANELGVRK